MILHTMMDIDDNLIDYNSIKEFVAQYSCLARFQVGMTVMYKKLPQDSCINLVWSLHGSLFY